MTATNIKTVETKDLVAELASREGVEHARLLDGMYTSVSVSGPMDVLMVVRASNDREEPAAESAE